MWNILRLIPNRHIIQSSLIQRSFSHALPASSSAVLVNNENTNNLMSFLTELWDGFLMAVPKKRRSLAKRRHMRKFNKLEPRNDIEDCVVCGGKKLCGKLCHNCFQWTMSLTEKVWQKQKDEGGCRKDRYVR